MLVGNVALYYPSIVVERLRAAESATGRDCLNTSEKLTLPTPSVGCSMTATADPLWILGQRGTPGMCSVRDVGPAAQSPSRRPPAKRCGPAGIVVLQPWCHASRHHPWDLLTDTATMGWNWLPVPPLTAPPATGPSAPTRRARDSRAIRCDPVYILVKWFLAHNREILTFSCQEKPGFLARKMLV